MSHTVIDADRPLAAVATSFIGVEHLVNFLRFVCRRVDDLAIFEFERDVVEHCALITRLRVKPNSAIDGFTHRRSENFAVWNISLSPTFDDRDSLDRKLQLGL